MSRCDGRGLGVELAAQAPTSLHREYQTRPQRILLARVVRGHASNHYGNVCAEIDTGVTEHHNGVTVAVQARGTLAANRTDAAFEHDQIVGRCLYCEDVGDGAVSSTGIHIGEHGVNQ